MVLHSKTLEMIPAETIIDFSNILAPRLFHFSSRYANPDNHTEEMF